jgi:eukaryotic-like serine/threonine-protein kinase
MNAPQPDSWIGRSIGDRQRYRIDKRLDKGGMGDVFLTMDTLLGQQVALKLLKDTLVGSEDLKKRFEREVALSASLRSDHIVHISDYGMTSEGNPFYVMEYLRGQSLGQLLRREQRLSVERSVEIITQVCRGLGVAHQGVTLWQDGATVSEYIKVVHRDLKPANIFLVPTALGELVKIIDFGIAKKIHDDKVEQTALTSTFLGTFRYAAPEQLEVKKNLDERADIYSLGIILYEMLSGADPFGFGIKARTTSGVAWAMAHSSKPPQPLRSQPGCEQIPLELEAVILRCLQKSPDKRFASVEELSRELRAAAQVATVDKSYQGLQEAAIAALNAANIAEAPSPVNQGSIDITVIRPLVCSSRGVPDATVAQTPHATQGSDDKTIPQPLAPAEQGIVDGTIAQVPSSSQDVSKEMPAQVPSLHIQGLLNATIVQVSSAHQGLQDRTTAQSASPQQKQCPDITTAQAISKHGCRVDETVVSQSLDTSSQRIFDETVVDVQSPPRHRSLPRQYFLLIGTGITIGLAVTSVIYICTKFQPRDTQNLKDIEMLQIEAKHEQCIARAEAITQDSSLYGEVQRTLNQCRMEQAKKLAAEQELEAAIALARKVPQNSPLHSEAQTLINQWTQQPDSSI